MLDLRRFILFLSLRFFDQFLFGLHVVLDDFHGSLALILFGLCLIVTLIL